MLRLAQRVRLPSRRAWVMDTRNAPCCRRAWLAACAGPAAQAPDETHGDDAGRSALARGALPKWRVFRGHPTQVAQARRFVAGVLNGCSLTDTAVHLTSELATNALAHTPSGTGGSFEVIVWRDADCVLIAVLDDGSDGSPAAAGVDLESESGRGLGLVAALADRWGHEGGGAARAVWFLLCEGDE